MNTAPGTLIMGRNVSPAIILMPTGSVVSTAYMNMPDCRTIVLRADDASGWRSIVVGTWYDPLIHSHQVGSGSGMNVTVSTPNESCRTPF